MIALSDKSIKTMMHYLYYGDDMKTLRNMRRICFRYNRIATLNNLHKPKPSHFTLSLNRNVVRTDGKMELYAYIGIHIDDYIDERLTVLENEMGPDNALLAEAERHMMDEVSNKHFHSRTCYIVERKLSDINFFAKRALKEVLNKAGSINGLTLDCFRLNTQFLHLLMQFKEQIRGATSIKIDNCFIKWTEIELSQFLALFDNLREIYISGSFHSAIVTDQHLSLATLEKITIICDFSTLELNNLHFPGITSKSTENWKENGIKEIFFLNMSTEITYSALRKFAEDFLQLGKRINESWMAQSPLNFGRIKYSADAYRRIILDQKNRHEQWRIIKWIAEEHQYMVSCNNKTYVYQFNIREPCEVPDFAKLLATVHQLRVEALDEEMTDTDRLYSTTRTIGKILEEYEKRKGLSAMAKSDLHDAAAEEAIPNDRIDQRIAVAKRFAFSHSLYHEEVIMLRMRELEEPLPAAII